MEKHSEKFLKKRRFLLVLPVLIIPFLTMAFWAAGGGKAKGKNTFVAKQGLNTKLPDPKLKDNPSLNKLSFYEIARKDSQKIQMAMENDRYGFPTDSNKYSLSNLRNMAKNYSEMYHQPGLIESEGLNLGNNNDRSKIAEENLLKKLNQLEISINTPESEKSLSNNRSISRTSNQTSTLGFSSDVDRLQNMMQVMQSDGSDNTEMKKLDTVLDKIIDIQNPERVKQKIKEKEKLNKKSVLPVTPHENLPIISVMGNGVTSDINSSIGFYSVGASDFDTFSNNAIEAAINETQTIVSGSVVKLRLLDSININGNLIPKGNFVYGVAKLSGERLNIEINSIGYNNSLYPVNLSVYDLDGLQGIYVPGAITRDGAKQSANSSVESMSLTTLDQSLAAQATTAGINAAKDLFNKKIKLIKVNLKAGYKVLLKINNN